MSEESSITDWLRELRNGDAAAMQRLWERFFNRLVAVADEQLKIASTNLVDGEDVAASVFESLWRGAQEGRFQKVSSVDEVIWLLLAMTKRKCIDQARRAQAQRRGGKQPRLSLNMSPDGLFVEIVSQVPDPQYVTTLNDEYDRVLGLLGDQVLRQITTLRVEGHTASEIALRMDLAESTVRRKLRIVRRIWRHELVDQPE